MKSCSYCGAEYPDEVERCPIDNAPVIEAPAAATAVKARFAISRMLEALTSRRIMVILAALLASAAMGVLGLRFLHYSKAVTATAQAAHNCIQTLIDIDYAKRAWAADFAKDSNANPTWDDLAPYLHWDHYAGFQPPTCPSGGAYTIGRVADFPTCSSPEHSVALAEVIIHVGDAALDDPYGGDSETYYEHDELKRRPAGSIVGAKVVVLDETGQRTKGVTDLRGTAFVDTWPNKPLAVIVSKRGFITGSNPIPVDIFRSGMRVRLQRQS